MQFIKHMLLGLLIIVLLMALYMYINYNELDGSTEVIAIGYHDDACEECNVLKSKMMRINLVQGFLLQQPIVFIKYDKTSEDSRLNAEDKLHQAEMYEIAKRDNGLRYVILYDAETKETLDSLHWDDTPEELTRKVEAAIEEAY